MPCALVLGNGERAADHHCILVLPLDHRTGCILTALPFATMTIIAAYVLPFTVGTSADTLGIHFVITIRQTWRATGNDGSRTTQEPVNSILTFCAVGNCTSCASRWATAKPAYVAAARVRQTACTAAIRCSFCLTGFVILPASSTIRRAPSAATLCGRTIRSG